MAKQQQRLPDRAQLVPISLYPQTIAQLAEVQRTSGESRGALVRRLVEREADRLRKTGIQRAPVWTFPGYKASGPLIPARIIYRSANAEDRIFEADSDRVLPAPATGSYVVIGQGPDQLRGQIESAEQIDVDSSPVLVITVRELVPPAGYDVAPMLFDFVLGVNADVAVRLTVDVTFDPFRTTPSWKFGDNEVRAMLVGPPGQRARSVRFLPFSGPTFQDHLNPVGDYFPIIDVDDVAARHDAADRIARFLESGPENPKDSEVSNAVWVEAIYSIIHDELGGNASQAGAPRRFGSGIFGHAADYKPDGDRGVVQFIVTIASGPNRGHRRSERYPWRTTAATIVAADAIRNYRRLLKGD
jgi:hypothetical protein